MELSNKKGRPIDIYNTGKNQKKYAEWEKPNNE